MTEPMLFCKEDSKSKTMQRILGYASLIGFVSALVVHIAALTGIDVADKFPAVWGLHVGVFVVLIPFLFSSRKALGSKPTLSRYVQLFRCGPSDWASVFLRTYW